MIKKMKISPKQRVLFETIIPKNISENQPDTIFEERKDETQINKNLNNLTRELKRTKKDFENFKKEQNIKLIEFLGIFTAILAFITISSKIIIDNLTVLNVLVLMPMFALILMLFVLGIDSLIYKENRKVYWWIFGIALILYITSIIMVKLCWI